MTPKIEEEKSSCVYFFNLFTSSCLQWFKIMAIFSLLYDCFFTNSLESKKKKGNKLISMMLIMSFSDLYTGLAEPIGDLGHGLRPPSGTRPKKK
jgi:hypothetical protein